MAQTSTSSLLPWIYQVKSLNYKFSTVKKMLAVFFYKTAHLNISTLGGLESFIEFMFKFYASISCHPVELK